MFIFTKKHFLMLMLLFTHVSINAEVIAVLTESTASGNYFDLGNESGVEQVSFDDPQISEQFGDKDLGSAGTFDSVSDLEGDTILFKNGNAAFGSQAQSFSRTVVDITFKNTGNESVRPVLDSQILPAGMGFYVSDCTAENLRACGSRTQSGYGFGDIQSYNGPGGIAISTMFNFQVVAEGSSDPLFALSGSLALVIGENGEPNQIIENFSEVESFLTDFGLTSPLGSEQEVSFDWGATDFKVIFPNDLLPNQSSSVSYITEVTTTTSALCVENGELACPVAFGAFGDPIGRGGGSTTRPQNAIGIQAASFVSSTTAPITGYEAGLYKMAAPTFIDGVLTYRAISGPQINANSVSSPANIGLVCVVLVFWLASKRRNI